MQPLPGGLVLLRDSVEWEGRSLLKALVREAALRGEQVRVLGCEVSEEAFREGLDPETNGRLLYHDVFGDPRGWAGAAAALGALVRAAGPGPCTLAVDSLSWLLLRAPCGALCRALGAARAPTRVLGLLHEDAHGPGPAAALGSLARAQLTLGRARGWAEARVLRPQAGGRPREHAQWLRVGPGYSLRAGAAPPGEPAPAPAPARAPAARAPAGLPFRLHLSEAERAARDALALPFHFSSEKQRASLGPAAGHILYEPEDGDDPDQEDPDDDLDI
ncbi:elongator complex protein 5 [Macrotis lagotis]|uniref:elongator complex protein 5 n=1 Tax=Macrotis lagotis TaxID=92651 RepID=UPI003D695EF8